MIKKQSEKLYTDRKYVQLTLKSIGEGTQDITLVETNHPVYKLKPVISLLVKTYTRIDRK